MGALIQGGDKKKGGSKNEKKGRGHQEIVRQRPGNEGYGLLKGGKVVLYWGNMGGEREGMQGRAHRPSIYTYCSKGELGLN